MVVERLRWAERADNFRIARHPTIEDRIEDGGQAHTIFSPKVGLQAKMR